MLNMQINQVIPVIFYSLEQRIHNTLYFGVQDQFFHNCSKLNVLYFSIGTSEIHCFLGINTRSARKGFTQSMKIHVVLMPKKLSLIQVFSNQPAICIAYQILSKALPIASHNKAYYSSPKPYQILGKFPLCLSIAHESSSLRVIGFLKHRPGQASLQQEVEETEQSKLPFRTILFSVLKVIYQQLFPKLP